MDYQIKQKPGSIKERHEDESGEEAEKERKLASGGGLNGVCGQEKPGSQPISKTRYFVHDFRRLPFSSP